MTVASPWTAWCDSACPRLLVLFYPLEAWFVSTFQSHWSHQASNHPKRHLRHSRFAHYGLSAHSSWRRLDCGGGPHVVGDLATRSQVAKESNHTSVASWYQYKVHAHSDSNKVRLLSGNKRPKQASLFKLTKSLYLWAALSHNLKPFRSLFLVKSNLIDEARDQILKRLAPFRSTTKSYGSLFQLYFLVLSPHP